MTATVLKLPTGSAGHGHKDALSLEERASLLALEFADRTAEEILKAAILDIFPNRIALVSSFGAESIVLLHLAAQIKPDVPVIFLDTEKHFAQTLSYRKKVIAFLGLTNVINVHPDRDELDDKDASGNLWRQDPDTCCTIRKVNPLAKTLTGYDSWITGRKQFHGGGRIKLPSFDAAAPHIKVNPIATWSPDKVHAYMEEHALPVHPLLDQGYPSIGCWPCTHPVAEGDDVRAGRWRGAAKTECGIHQQ